MRRPPVKLRDTRIVSADDAGEPLANFNCVSGAVAAIFTRHVERLVSLIHEYDFAFGCAAWLTHPKILDALATRRWAQIVVQKEDFLRPDGEDEGASWKSTLQQRYSRLNGVSRYDAPGCVRNMSCATGSHVEGVRCMGMRGERNVPRMHHKFLVLGKTQVIDSELAGCIKWQPRCVWTGSFNFTQNAENSIENAVVIHDEKIAQAYLDEWSQVLALSESCDWKSEYVAPEWRIGT